MPTKLNFVVLGYGYTSGNIFVDPSLPLEDLNSKIHMPVFGYLRSLNIAGQNAKINIIVPYAWFSGSGKFTEDIELTYRKVSGFADPKFQFTLNLYGAPALSLKEYMKYQQKSILGVSFMVSAPLGQYDPSKLGNIGTNRWAFKPQIGFSRTLGPVILETSAAVSFFTTNKNFWGGNVRKQRPMVALQGHGIYAFKSGIWTAVNVTYYAGGRTIVNDSINNDMQTNWGFGLTLALPVNRRNSVKLYASTGLIKRTGNAFTLVGALWQYRWGGGV